MEKFETACVIDAINCLGLDNSQWGIVEDVNICAYFGIDYDVELTGYNIWVCLEAHSMDECYWNDNVRIEPFIMVEDIDKEIGHDPEGITYHYYFYQL